MSSIPGKINIDGGLIRDHRPLYEGDEYMSLYGVYDFTTDWVLGRTLHSLNWIFKPMAF